MYTKEWVIPRDDAMTVHQRKRSLWSKSLARHSPQNMTPVGTKT